MANSVRLRLCLLASVLLFASVSVAFAEFDFELDLDNQDPRKERAQREYAVCRSSCQSEERGRGQQQTCLKRCQEKLREREQEEHGGRDRGIPEEDRRDPERKPEEQRREEERREWERKREREREHGRGRGHEDNRRDPEREREDQRRREEEKRREREREQREREREGRGKEREWEREEQQSREEEQERERGRGFGNPREFEREQRYNPYYFHEKRFRLRSASDDGHIRVLEKFTDKSELLKGIKHYRFSVLEARPLTFIIPHHLDAESVLLVSKGKATITLVWQEKRETKKETHNLETGDVMTVPTGTTCYLINHGNEDLEIVKMARSLNVPGDFKEYFAAGSENQAYYSVFSNDVLEASLNIPRDQLERIFRQRKDRREAIIKISEEHIKQLTQSATSTRRGGGHGTRSPIKLRSQSPVYTNRFGQLLEVCPDDFPQLRKADVAVVVTDIKQGGMMVPHFSSRATWVLFVSEGTGSFEMACPHVQGGEWQKGRSEEGRHDRRWEEQVERGHESGEFHRVTGPLLPGGVLVVPAGHPIAIIASKNENLRLVGFGINGENNHRNFLAGKENIMNEVEQEALALAFDIEGKQADQIFRSQKESFFTEGPREGGRRSSEEKRSHPLLSVLAGIV